ncbi:signal peptidase II [Simkania negevensis]|uniref:Lipoprotein signal peptidase n=1 Tax=Simkania negevensis TaxID=83561 RepID=A0ABS3ARP4_9BACT|nr:signal peptidase II [Simkania negevensis]
MSKRELGGCTLLVALLVFVDFALKSLVLAYIPKAVGSYPYGGVGVFQHFFGIECSVIHVTNTGAAWSFFSEYPGRLLIVRFAMVFLLACYLFFGNHRFATAVPLSLILAGAVGNIIDNILYGHVIDMFSFVFWGYHYPVFNLADAFITMGVGWLLCHSFVHKKKRLVDGEDCAS